MVSVRGDEENPVTLGYACSKGITLAEAHHHPERLLHPLKRGPDGRFVRIGLEQALERKAEKAAASAPSPDAASQ